MKLGAPALPTALSMRYVTIIIQAAVPRHTAYCTFDMYTESELLKVKVLLIFLGTMGFSPPREGRYYYGGWLGWLDDVENESSLE